MSENVSHRRGSSTERSYEPPHIIRCFAIFAVIIIRFFCWFFVRLDGPWIATFDGLNAIFLCVFLPNPSSTSRITVGVAVVGLTNNVPGRFTSLKCGSIGWYDNTCESVCEFFFLLSQRRVDRVARTKCRQSHVSGVEILSSSCDQRSSELLRCTPIIQRGITPITEVGTSHVPCFSLPVDLMWTEPYFSGHIYCPPYYSVARDALRPFELCSQHSPP